MLLWFAKIPSAPIQALVHLPGGAGTAFRLRFHCGGLFGNSVKAVCPTAMRELRNTRIVINP